MRAARNADELPPPLWYLALGLTGEAGEVANLVRKFLEPGSSFDHNAIADKLGDALWYLAAAAHGVGLSLDEVAARNVEKLQARYPDRFKPAGGGADADKAAGRKVTVEEATDYVFEKWGPLLQRLADNPVDHSAAIYHDPRPTAEHPAEPEPEPAPPDDGVRVGEWKRWKNGIWSIRYVWKDMLFPAGKVWRDLTWRAWGVEKKWPSRLDVEFRIKNSDGPAPDLETAKRAVEDAIRVWHPHAFDDLKTKETA